MNPSDLFVLLVLVVLLVLALALAGVGGGLVLDRTTGKDAQSGKAGLDLLNRQWRIERRIYRHHRLAGLLIIAAALFFFFKTWHLGLFVPGRLPSTWQLGWGLLVGGNVLSLIIGFILLLRPSRLKPVETLSNRWIELDIESLAHILRARPRLRGTLILLISLVCAAGFGTLLLMLIGY